MNRKKKRLSKERHRRIDGGTVAGVAMPMYPDEAMRPSGAPADKGRAPIHGRILLAEDGRDNQRLLAMHLHDCGAEVAIAENGKIAVELAAKDSFDLVLMDMQMPVMDGYTAAAEMRRQGFKMPIIALTASALREDRQKTIASGCTDYLSKPVDLDLFLKVVSKYLAERSAATAPPEFPAAPSPSKARRTKKTN